MPQSFSAPQDRGARLLTARLTLDDSSEIPRKSHQGGTSRPHAVADGYVSKSQVRVSTIRPYTRGESEQCGGYYAPGVIRRIKSTYSRIPAYRALPWFLFSFPPGIDTSRRLFLLTRSMHLFVGPMMKKYEARTSFESRSSFHAVIRLRKDRYLSRIR